MCWRIEKEFKFEAAHQLLNLPEGHQCGRLHGHSYTVTVAIESNELQREGWIKDFGELGPLKGYINTNFDHKFLNDLLPSTTSESLAQHFYLWCKSNIDLPLNANWAWTRVSETESSSATYWR